MKAGIIYAFLGAIIFGVIYTACKDITPEQNRVETIVELKLTK